MKRLKQLLLAATALAIVGAAVYYSMAPRPLLVEAVVATRESLQVSIVEEGKTRVADRYVVSAPVAGMADRVTLDVGDRVRRGQLIVKLAPLRPAVLDTRSRAESQARVAAAAAALEQAREEVESARSDVRYWETEMPRIRDGVEAGVTARDRLDRAQADERKAKALLRVAEQAVEVARRNVDVAEAALRTSAPAGNGVAAETVLVRTPVAGRILKRHHESASVLQAGAPLVEIADSNGLEVEVEVLSSDAVQITDGIRVLLERWGGEHPLEARVRTVEPVAFTKISALGVEEQRVLVIVDITADREQWRSLGDQYRVEARFVLWEEAQVLQVPSSALFRQGGGWALYAVEGELARLRLVEIGRRSGQRAEVLSGVSEGDRVVNHPSDEIADGALIELVE